VDHHQDWIFRHDKRIPDEISPDAWRNLKLGGNETANEEAVPAKKKGSYLEVDFVVIMYSIYVESKV
jgi:hypothetical protein